MKSRTFTFTATVADQDEDLLDRLPALLPDRFSGGALAVSGVGPAPAALVLPLRPVAFIWDAPAAVTENHYGIAMGWYVDCDDAVCRHCAPRGFASDDFSEWPGFEGWESPIAICYDDESDSVTHCRQCGAVIAHDLTTEGGESVKEAIAEMISEPGRHTPDAIAQWWEAYAGRGLGEKDYADILEYAGVSLRDVIEHLMVAAGCRQYVPGGQPDNGQDPLPGLSDRSE